MFFVWQPGLPHKGAEASHTIRYAALRESLALVVLFLRVVYPQGVMGLFISVCVVASVWTRGKRSSE